LAVAASRDPGIEVAETEPRGMGVELDWIDKATAGRQGERTDLVNNINEVERAPRPVGTSAAAAMRPANFALLEFSEVACNARCGRPHKYPPW
jgi:hypothetical protein